MSKSNAGFLLLQYDFEELVSKIAKEIDVIVPIISFKEVSREDWRHLPQLIKNGMGRPADIVVCTHLDQASLYLWNIARAVRLG